MAQVLEVTKVRCDGLCGRSYPISVPAPDGWHHSERYGIDICPDCAEEGLSVTAILESEDTW